MISLDAEQFREQFGEGFDLTSIACFENAKGMILPRLTGEGRKREGVPFRSIDELAVTYYIPVHDVGDSEMDIVVTHELLSRWDATEEDIYETAVDNLAEHTVFRPMDEILNEVLTGMGLGMPCGTPMWVLTNESRMYGASQILNRSVLEKAAERIDGDFFILPSSVHEVICLGRDDEYDISELLSTIRYVNETELEPQDRLTDKLLLFSVRSGLKLISEFM